MKRFVGYVIDKAIKAIPRKKKVSPDIKSTKPTKDIKGSVERTKSDVFSKNIKDLDAAEKKIREGKKMMKAGQKSRKQMTGTGRAFQFKGVKSYHAVKPGDKDKFKGNIRQEKTKKFKTAKELEQQEYFKYKKREKKMGGGMMGRRFGYSEGSSKGKIPTTPKEKSLAKLAPPRDRITFGDVVAGRTKGAKNGKTMS